MGKLLCLWHVAGGNGRSRIVQAQRCIVGRQPQRFFKPDECLREILCIGAALGQVMKSIRQKQFVFKVGAFEITRGLSVLGYLIMLQK